MFKRRTLSKLNYTPFFVGKNAPRFIPKKAKLVSYDMRNTKFGHVNNYKDPLVIPKSFLHVLQKAFEKPTKTPISIISKLEK